jgi:tetratricopeptide (TPR) repeat protein
MEEEKYGHAYEDEVKKAVQKFERMKKNNESCYFDVVEFESIIDYYIEVNNSLKASEAAAFATEQHPCSVSIQLRKAKILLDKGRAVETLKILRKLESIEPGNHDIYITKGTAMGILGDINGAKKMFDYALSLDSDDVENTLFSIVSVLQNLNYYEQLIPYLLKLVDKEPNYHAHLYDLAYAYEKTEDYRNSITYYLKYIEEEPFSDSAWYNLGIIYNKLEMFDKAMEAYDYALAINYQNAFALFNKGNILCNLGRYPEAIAVYHEYLDNEPDSVEAMTYLAECYEKTGDFILARKYYRDAIELAPEYADPWFGLGVIEMNTGNPGDSIIYFRKAVRLDDNNPEYWFLLGKAQYFNGDIKNALSCYREALKLDAYYDEAWSDLGKIIIKEGLASRAVRYLEHAYKITGNVPGINFILATLYLRTGRNESASRHFSLAIDMDRDSFVEFSDLFPRDILTKKIMRILEKIGFPE